MDFGKAFLFVTEDDDWIKKIAIGAVLTFFSSGDVNMNSYSHYAYGAVVEWMFDTVAGIDHGDVGFQHFTLQPQPGGRPGT